MDKAPLTFKRSQEINEILNFRQPLRRQLPDFLNQQLLCCAHRIASCGPSLTVPYLLPPSPQAFNTY